MSLLSLSTELLNHIASHLIPTMDDDTGSYDPDPDFRSCRLALLSLVKTGNHKLHAIAIPHLYHTVCIYDIRCLFDFLHTLVHHPHLADFVRVLNLATFLDGRLDDCTDDKSQALYAGITPDMKAFSFLPLCFGDDFEELSWSETDDFAELSFGLLLCLTNRLESLHLHSPNWNAGDLDPLAAVFASAYDDRAPLPGGFLPRLSRLALSADPRCDDPLLPAGTPGCFMGPGNIKHLELFGANLQGDDELDLAKWRSVETIRISYAHATGSWWYELCSKARPKLRCVDISISPYSSGDDSPANEGFNAAFALCAESLESLRLDFDSVGTHAWIDCVRNMHKLRYLDVSVAVLFASPTAMGRQNICDVLPPPLEELCLRDDVIEAWEDLLPDIDEDAELDWSSPGLGKDAPGVIERALLQLALESESKLPRLRWVRVVVDERLNERLLEGLFTCPVERDGSRFTYTCVPRRSR
ncbi:hypothetical protein B0T14DRAFT_149264 [Immersiella caudata]|uniref:Uncharacterized protein n=1 Tax=Immersiella caudata TaxID=314043 RepID=A0AA39WVT6_9PEZI|nr:hypothetical protein B0T14DRAFT_149264 [Immersiella caudata]